MTGKTHIMGGITASLAVAHAANENPLIMVGAGIAGALLPDICHSGSRIGRRFPILSRIINLLFGHRTFTHSLLFLVIVSFLIDRFFPNDILKYGLLTGMVSHYISGYGDKKRHQALLPARPHCPLPSPSEPEARWRT